jgi:hypothetical protein
MDWDTLPVLDETQCLVAGVVGVTQHCNELGRNFVVKVLVTESDYIQKHKVALNWLRKELSKKGTRNSAGGWQEYVWAHFKITPRWMSKLLSNQPLFSHKQKQITGDVETDDEKKTGTSTITVKPVKPTLQLLKMVWDDVLATKRSDASRQQFVTDFVTHLSKDEMEMISSAISKRFLKDTTYPTKRAEKKAAAEAAEKIKSAAPTVPLEAPAPIADAVTVADVPPIADTPLPNPNETAFSDTNFAAWNGKPAAGEKPTYKMCNAEAQKRYIENKKKKILAGLEKKSKTMRYNLDHNIVSKAEEKRGKAIDKAMKKEEAATA